MIARSARPISAIVPVFNERQTVARVLATLEANQLVGEVICIDDGSTDGSRTLLESLGERIDLIAFEANHGKGQALAAGLGKARYGIVAFFDADLTSLSEEHVATLVAPLLAGEARAVLGYPEAASRYLAKALAPYTGERAYFRDDLLPHLPRIARSRFGAEVVLNSLIPHADTRVVALDGLVGLDKRAKHGSPDAVREYWGEAVDITRELARQRVAASYQGVVARFAAAMSTREPRG